MPQSRRRKDRKPNPKPTSNQNPGITPLGNPTDYSPEQLVSLGESLRGQPFASSAELDAYFETMMIDLVGDGAGIAPEGSPLWKAQELVYDAYDSDDRNRRVRLAHRALKISPDCADALVILADDEAQTPQRSLELLEEAVRAGERAIGEEGFQANAGNFWGIHETRPYMRARQALASLLWLLGDREPALDHYRALLELNPEDNQGNRYIVLLAMFDQNDDDAVRELLGRYDEEESAIWTWSKTLLRFRTDGDTAEARADLRLAVESNPYVPDYLLGAEPMPTEIPEFSGIGDESEARSYMVGSISGWLRTPGAIEWVRAHAPLSGLERPAYDPALTEYLAP